MADFTPIGVEAVVKNLNKFTSDLGKMDSSIQSTGRSAGSVTTSFSGLGSSLGSAAKLAAGAVVIGFTAAAGAVVGLGVAGLTAAISYESAFAGVIKTTDGLTDSTGNLNKAGEALSLGFRALSKEIPITPETLANIGELGGQLGIQRDNLLDFTEAIAKVGVSTVLTEEAAATGFARIANILGTSQEKFSNMGSSIVALGNNFATTEDSILNFSTRIAGAGAIVGLTEGDIFGIGTAFSSVGVQSEAGGTAVQKVLLGINTALVEGSDKVDIFASTAGLSSAKFASLWETDASSAFQLFVEGLGKQGDQAILTLDELGLKDQRLVRSFLSLATAGDLLGESISLGNTAFEENTALTVEAEARFKTTESQIQLLKNIFNDISISIGNTFLPIFNELLQKFATFVKDNESTLIPLFEGIASFLETNIPKAITKLSALWTGTLQPAFTNMVKFLQENVPKAVSFLTDTFNNILLPAFISISSFVTTTLFEAFGILKNVFSEVVTFVTTNLLPIFQDIGKLLRGDMTEDTEGFIGVWATKLNPIVLSVQNTLGNLIKFCEQNGPAILEVATKVLGKTIELFTTIANVIIPLVITNFEKISKWWVDNGPAIVELLQEFAKEFAVMADIIAIIWTTIIGPVLTLLSNAILGLASLVIAVANGDWSNAWGDMKTTVGAMAEATDSLVIGLLETIAGAMGSSLSEIGAMWSSNWKNLKEIVSLTLGQTVTSITSIEWFAIGSNIMNTFINGIKALLGDIGNTIRMITTIITTAIANTEWFSVGVNIISGIQAGVSSRGGDLINTMRNTAQQALNAVNQALGIHSPSLKFMEVGHNITQGVAVGVTQGTSEATQAVSNMGQMLLGQQGIGSIGAMGQQVMGSQMVQSPTTNNTQSNTFNNNISGGMDLATVEAVIKRVIGASI